MNLVVTFRSVDAFLGLLGSSPRLRFLRLSVAHHLDGVSGRTSIHLRPFRVGYRSRCYHKSIAPLPTRVFAVLPYAVTNTLAHFEDAIYGKHAAFVQQAHPTNFRRTAEHHIALESMPCRPDI